MKLDHLIFIRHQTFLPIQGGNPYYSVQQTVLSNKKFLTLCGAFIQIKIHNSYENITRNKVLLFYEIFR